ncbi:hypothetical protein I4I80_02630 [Pseudomonas syringae pv. tomato]|nr:hypothetical protein [Pseudomonas syringae pv. tomato]MBW8023639.1 hypothetical protein [Pseudomonas syringae pv. tomato]
MIDDGLEEARMDLAKIKASLETSLAALELVPIEPGAEAIAVRARVVEEVKQTLQSVELLAQNIGGIPAPVLH